jgi:VanZ family protein
MDTKSTVPFPLLPGWVRWLFVAVVGAFIFYVSIVTVPPETALDTRPDMIPLDKWRHFLAYAAFGGTLAYATTDWELDRRMLAAGVVGVTVLYGVGIEVGQSALPARYFSLGDAYANALGGLLVTPWYAIRSRLSFVPVRELVAAVR